VLNPGLRVDPGRLVTMGTVVIVAAVGCAIAAAEILRRLDPAEILREE
jgi:hypothetical protein